MPFAFRNVDANPDDPVQTWPQEALAAAVERGSLQHWRRIARAVEADPWGPVATMLEEILTYSRPYGVAELLEMAIENARVAADRRDRDEAAERMRQAFQRTGMTMTEFAARLGTSRSRMSTYLSGKVTPSAALLVRMERSGREHPHVAGHPRTW